MDTLLDRFLRYVKIDTQSQEVRMLIPVHLGRCSWRLLKRSSRNWLINVRLSDWGHLMAELPPTLIKIFVSGLLPPDTSPMCPAKCEAPALS